MIHTPRPTVTAVLGPTNTGKTHLAVERMLAHSSGMIGFPLRLLAREVYDRVVRMKGADQVALLTGEERIRPETARYFLCTAEAMPGGTYLRTGGAHNAVQAGAFDVAFAAIDEAQLAVDRERGHVFTQRIQLMRGREETMILGSSSLRPIVRALIPDAQIVSRPRFSTLSYTGPQKLANLPPRTGIIAFSADEVYAIAEALRRISGGAAVVMGALSPRTRNAQVSMFQRGEVDYLVATDAVGMGLNLDLEQVVFSSLHKFDGVEQRRLHVSEMAQIAGRAGRHQRDGSFGTLSGRSTLTPEEIAALEDHRFEPLRWIYWRNPAPAMDSVDALIMGLEQAPADAMLRSAPPASDLTVLRRLHDDGATAAADGPDMVRRLWDACSLPDFRNAGPEAHSRLVTHVWRSLSSGTGHVDSDWFLAQLSLLDNEDGAIEVLSDRIAAVRSYCYIAQRADWLAEPQALAEKASDVDARLSDALHRALTERFVDRRTAVLMRGLGQDATSLPVVVDDASVVHVDGQAIGTLDGFAFRVDPAASASEHKMLRAAAEKYLTVELTERAMQLSGAHDGSFTLNATAGGAQEIVWRDTRVATLARGKHLLCPQAEMIAELAALDAHVVAAVRSKLDSYVDGAIGRHLRPLVALGAMARDATTPPDVRALLAVLVDDCGVVERAMVADTLRRIPQTFRHQLYDQGVRTGYLDIFLQPAMRPAALQWLTALRSVWRGEEVVAQPKPGIAWITADSDDGPGPLGFRRVGGHFLRVDLVEKIAREAHNARTGKRSLVRKSKRKRDLASAESPPQASEAVSGATAHGSASVVTPPSDVPPPQAGAFHICPEIIRSMGLSLAARMAILDMLGFSLVEPAALTNEVEAAGAWWIWRGCASTGQRRGKDERVELPPQGRARSQHSGTLGKGYSKGNGRGRGSALHGGRPAMPQFNEPPPLNNPFGALAGMFDSKDRKEDGEQD